MLTGSGMQSWALYIDGGSSPFYKREFMLSPNQIRILKQTLDGAKLGSTSARMMIEHLQKRAREGDEAAKELAEELRQMVQHHEESQVRKAGVVQVEFIVQVYEHQGGSDYLWTNFGAHLHQDIAVRQAEQIVKYVTRVVKVTNETVWESDPSEAEADTERAGS